MMIGMIKHSQSAQRNKVAVSLQYLKKEVTNGVKDQTFYKLGYHFLMKVARFVQSAQTRNFVEFLQYIKSMIT